MNTLENNSKRKSVYVESQSDVNRRHERTNGLKESLEGNDREDGDLKFRDEEGAKMGASIHYIRIPLETSRLQLRAALVGSALAGARFAAVPL